MRPLTDIRRDRLRQLIGEVAEGNQAAFAKMVGKSRAYVGFWLADPAKPHAKQISHTEARALEARFSKAAGWLDTDSQSAGLDLGILQVALVALKEAAAAEELEIDLFESAPIIAFAYRERLGMRSKPTKAQLRDFDKRIREQLRGDEGHAQWVGRTVDQGSGSVQKDAAKAPQGRRRRK